MNNEEVNEEIKEEIKETNNETCLSGESKTQLDKLIRENVDPFLTFLYNLWFYKRSLDPKNNPAHYNLFKHYLKLNNYQHTEDAGYGDEENILFLFVGDERWQILLSMYPIEYLEENFKNYDKYHSDGHRVAEYIEELKQAHKMGNCILAFKKQDSQGIPFIEHPLTLPSLLDYIKSFM